jgi:SAM-dependent methyltransferase
MKDFFSLLYLHFAVKFYELRAQHHVKKKFYKDALYKKVDQTVRKGENPYRIKEAFPYGETPLCSLKKIADRCELKPSDRVVDLGCGRGRGVFFLAHHYGCTVHGIDKVQSFISKGQSIIKNYNLSNVSFSCEEMLQYDCSSFSCVFFYGTCYDDIFVKAMVNNFTSLSKGSKIITISYSLPLFSVKETFQVSFPWGLGSVFIHQR